MMKIKELSFYFTEDSFMVDVLDESFESTTGSTDQADYWYPKFMEDKYQALFQIGFLTKKKWFSPSLEFLHLIAEQLISQLSRSPEIEFEREAYFLEMSAETYYQFQEEVPFAIGMEYVSKDWLNSIWINLLGIFQEAIKEFEGTVAQYFTRQNPDIQVAGRIFFHLVESKDEEMPFAFMATYSDKPVKSKKTVHTPLKNALEAFKEDEKKLIALIASVVKVAEESDFISRLLESGELFSPIRLTIEEAYTFLKEITLYESAGIMCRVPNWWRKKSNRIGVSVSVGEKKPSQVGLTAILDFAPRLHVGDEPLTEKEIRSFLTMAEGLIRFKGKWIEINKVKLEATLEAFEKIITEGDRLELTLSEAMRMELNIKETLEITDAQVEVTVSSGQWFRSLKETLNGRGTLEIARIPSTFYATLRAYQNDGYRWLQTMTRLGLGACLADDMGLGKTVQVIALLEQMRTEVGGKVLLVLPASLIGNWQKELERFAPKLNYQVLHASAVKGNETLLIDPDGFLSITTYGMAKRLESLKALTWDLIILDEAQAIKNPSTKQTKHIKEIPGKMKIALTGTPIENHLGDLWSLFDFLNPGLLGTTKEFKEIVKDLKEDLRGYSKLRQVINPFILRRLKTDKSIIKDLPDKIEINAYTALSKKQIALYKELVDELTHKLEAVDGIQRRGVVLASIMKFKQICNHPDQYLGREEFKPASSGKFEQLAEICETIYEKRERVLIFTQFREMTEPISDYLKTIFHKDGLVLHGGTSVKKRNEMVETFNGENYIPYMVLSLKAGGVGLNLTAANHVIHFDRWWNPAVENQATDRAFRIGQSKNVMVHKFVTKGTIEEKIDEMIRSKQQLASDILSSEGEQWITKYSNSELLELFALGGV